MSHVKVTCPNCERFEENIMVINALMTFAWAHRQDYTGEIFEYCPRCGTKLVRALDNQENWHPIKCTITEAINANYANPPAQLLDSSMEFQWLPPFPGAEPCEVNHAAPHLTSKQVQELFGRQVTINRQLKTIYISGYKRWYSSPIESVNGIFIGVRTLQQGRRTRDTDGCNFYPDGYLQGALVVVDPYKRPLYTPVTKVITQLNKPQLTEAEHD